MNISLPAALKAFVSEQAADGGYSTSSEYVRELIRKDRDRQRQAPGSAPGKPEHHTGGGDPGQSRAARQPPWMAGYGELADLGDDHRAVLQAVEDEFERIEPEDLP